jgi:hypothetical protein
MQSLSPLVCHDHIDLPTAPSGTDKPLVPVEQPHPTAAALPNVIGGRISPAPTSLPGGQRGTGPIARPFRRKSLGDDGGRRLDLYRGHLSGPNPRRQRVVIGFESELLFVGKVKRQESGRHGQDARSSSLISARGSDITEPCRRLS